MVATGVITIRALLGPLVQPQNVVEGQDTSPDTAVLFGALARFAQGVFDAPFTRKCVAVVGETGEQGIDFPATAFTVGELGPAGNFLVVLPQTSTRVVGRPIVGQVCVGGLAVAQNVAIPGLG